VSFFRLGSRQQDKRIAFYASHTEIVGADDMDRALAVRLAAKYPDAPQGTFDSRSAIRSAKQECDAGVLRVGKYELTSEEWTQALAPVFDRIFEVYRRAFGLAYRKEKQSSRWEKLTLVLVGGGSLVSGMADRLLKPPNPIVERRLNQTLALPTDVQTGLDHALPVTLLAVSFGLSFVAADIPDYWHPHEVEALPPRPSAQRRDKWGEDQA
jgi:hypothetical protein